MALLAAEALGLGDGDAGDADLVQRLLHLVELERLDDRFDLLHGANSAAAMQHMAVGGKRKRIIRVSLCSARNLGDRRPKGLIRKEALMRDR